MCLFQKISRKTDKVVKTAPCLFSVFENLLEAIDSIALRNNPREFATGIGDLAFFILNYYQL